MGRRPDFKAGDVLSFRIPENISAKDLDHLRHIAKRPTAGKTGAISEFFFAKVTEDRIQQLPHVSIPLPDLTKEEIALLDNPMFKKALSLYAYQLLGRSAAGVTDVATVTEDTHQNHGKSTHTLNQMANDLDPMALELMRKLRGP